MSPPTRRGPALVSRARVHALKEALNITQDSDLEADAEVIAAAYGIGRGYTLGRELLDLHDELTRSFDFREIPQPFRDLGRGYVGACRSVLAATGAPQPSAKPPRRTPPPAPPRPRAA